MDFQYKKNFANEYRHLEANFGNSHFCLLLSVFVGLKTFASTLNNAFIFAMHFVSVCLLIFVL